MLKKIEIENFRSHKSTTIEFDKGITVIVGRGQAGKTNIRRALEWLRYNRPAGDRVHSNWMNKGDTTKVSVLLDNGYIVSISKKKGSSLVYSIKTPKGKIEQFKKVGRNVPDKVVELLNIDDINIQNQLDHPFLITGSTSDISKVVNKIVDLEIADEWLKKLSSMKLQVARDIKSNKRRLDESQKAISAYVDMQKIEALLGVATDTQLKIDEKTELVDKLSSCISEVKESKKQLSKVRHLADLDKSVKMADRLVKKIKDKKSLLGACSQLIYEKYELDNAQKNHDKIESEYRKLLLKLKACPTCHRKLDKNSVEAMINKA